MGRGVLLVVLLLAGGLVSVAPPTAAADGVVRVDGRVVDARGRPAADATVFVALHDLAASFGGDPVRPMVRSVRSGSDGRFGLRVPAPAADWAGSAVAVKEGHGSGGQELRLSLPTSGLLLTLTPPGFVGGRVLDHRGQPVSGATLRLQWATRRDREMAHLPPEEARPRALTDAQGRFRLGSLPAECRLTLIVEHPLYARFVSLYDPIQSGREDLLVALRPAARLVGRVLDQDGRPAPNVIVQCRRDFLSPPDGRTDARGEFRFDNLPPESHVVTVILPGDRPAAVADPVEVTPQEGAELRCPDLRLTRGGLLTGRVGDDRGRPVPGIVVHAHRILGRSGNSANGGRIRSAPDGTYRLRLPAGRWQVGASPLNDRFDGDYHLAGDPGITIRADRLVRADFRVRRTVTLRGKVIDSSGRPAPRARIRATCQRDAGGFMTTRTTDAAGRFTLPGILPRDAVSLAVLASDRPEGAQTDLPVRPKDEQTLRLRRLPVLTGRVTDRGGRAVRDAFVHADRMVPVGGGTSGRLPALVAATTTDAQGRYTLGIFPDAQYHVAVEATGFSAAARYPVPVGLGRAPAPLSFTLERADGFVAGVVVDPESKPAPGARIMAMRSGSTASFLVFETTATDAEGRFRVAGLPGEGEADVSAQLPGHFPDFKRAVPIGSTSLHLMVSPMESGDPRVSELKPGMPAPEVSVARWVNGDGVARWSDLRGKTVVLQFSSANNSAARAANADLKALYAALRARDRTDVAVLALYDPAASSEEVAAYARAEGLPFPIGIVASSPDAASDPFRAYGVRRLPTLFVIDPGGTVRAVNPSREALMRMVE